MFRRNRLELVNKLPFSQLFFTLFNFPAKIHNFLR
jgi:hypothetical protein